MQSGFKLQQGGDQSPPEATTLYEDIMNKAELTRAVSERADVIPVKTDKVINAFLDLIVENISVGKSVCLGDFGAFQLKTESRDGINPMTGEVIIIPPRKSLNFRAGKSLKAAVR